MSILTSTIIHRLGERDRQLLLRFALRGSSQGAMLRAWKAITQMGSAPFAVACSIVPQAWPGPGREGGRLALAVLVFSHLIVQLVKRSVVRARPVAGTLGTVDVDVPDCFSFPSGHAAAAMAVAFGYATVMPEWAAFYVVLALVIGASRVALGVHYPGDVLAGQSLALLTGALVMAC